MTGRTRLPSERYLTSLADCARVLNDHDDWIPAVRSALKVVSETTGVSRVWIFQTIAREAEHVVQDHIFEYAAKRKWAQLDRNKFRLFRTGLDDPSYRRLVEGRVRGEPAFFVTEAIASGFLRSDQEEQKILSMLTVPIMIAGEWWGTLGLDDCERSIDWTNEDVTYLQTVAGLIAGSIHQERRIALARQVTVMERFTGGGMWELDLPTGRLWCSDSLFNMLGYPPPYAQMNVRRLARHLNPEDRIEVMAALRECLVGTRPGFRMDRRAHRLNGDPLWLELITNVARPDGQGNLAVRLAGLVLEASERKARELKLGEAALTDALTGLPNRRAFHARATRIMTEQRGRVALVMVDIDHFKRINDTLGHAAGDEALRALAQILRNTLREGDLVARIGGEEFAVLLPRDGREVFEVAERLRETVATTTLQITDMFGQHRDMTATISLGMACSLDSERTTESLKNILARADRALYRAKRSGRNCIQVDPDSGGLLEDVLTTPPRTESRTDA